MDGFIKLHRKFIEWEWYTDNNVKILFLHLLLSVNHKDNKWRGQFVKKGSVITSYEKLAIATGLTIQQIRTALNKLKSTGEITYQSTSLNSIITINNWNEYQENNKQNNKQITNEQQTNNKRITTNKNDKNDKNDKNVFLLEPKTKKMDPYINPIKDYFIQEYQNVFGQKPFLSNLDHNRLVELAADYKDIRELIPVALKRLKGIYFDDIQFKPTANWLLKENNFERVMNGEFEKTKSTREQQIERLLKNATEDY